MKRLLTWLAPYALGAAAGVAFTSIILKELLR